MPLDRAIKEYDSKLYDKSVKGDYRILEITLENEDDNKEDEKKESTGIKVDSKLPNPV